MRVLVASYYLGGLTGSETFWYTVIDHLVKCGADVTFHCAVPGDRAGELLDLGATVWPFLNWGDSVDPDIVLVSHGPMVEWVYERWPRVPMFYFCHGVLPALERVPDIEAEWRWFFGVSQETMDSMMARGIPARCIAGPFQPVDSERFRPTADGAPRERKVLVVSNRMPAGVFGRIQRAGGRVGAELRCVGEPFSVVGQNVLPRCMASSKVVISLGRGVIEAMMSGAVPIVYDYQGADGVVTPENFDELAEYNFSGRKYGATWDVKRVSMEISRAMQYDGARLRKMAVERYDAKRLVADLGRLMEEEV